MQSEPEYNLEKTINGLDVRILKTIKPCNCNLSSYVLTGEVLFDGKWVSSKWNLNGICVNGFKDWSLSGYPKNNE